MPEDPGRLPGTNLEEKIMIIDYFKNSNKPQSETVEHFKDKFSISTSSFSEWLKHEEELRERYIRAVNGPRGVSENLKLSKRKSTFKYGPINDAMHKVVSERLSMDLPVTEPILRHYWSEFTKEYGVTDPKRAKSFSHGWLANFKKRHGLTKVKKVKSLTKNAFNAYQGNGINGSTTNISKSGTYSENRDLPNTSDNFLRSAPKSREMYPVSLSTVVNNSTNNSGQYSLNFAPIAGVNSYEQDNNAKSLLVSNKRNKMSPVNGVNGIYNSGNGTYSAEVPSPSPPSQLSENNKKSNSSTTLNYLLISNENGGSYSSLSYVRPRPDTEYSLLPNEYQKPSSVTFSNITENNTNTNTNTNNENSGTTAIDSSTNRSSSGNDYDQKNRTPGDTNEDNSSTSKTHTSSTSPGNKYGSGGDTNNSGANGSSSTGSQFNLQQILNSHLSKPLTSTPIQHSNFSINMNPGMNSRAGPHYQNLIYARNNGSTSMGRKNLNPTASPVYSNGTGTGTGTFMSNVQNTMLESMSNVPKKASANYASTPSSSLPVQSFLPKVNAQSSAILSSVENKIPYHNYSTSALNSRQLPEDYINTSSRMVLDIGDKAGKNEPVLVQARHLLPIVSHPQSFNYSEVDSKERQSRKADDVAAPIDTARIKVTSEDYNNESSWRLESKSFDEKEKFSFDDMEKLLFVHADKFFKQFKGTHEFEQSKELFEEFKTRFMADKHQYLAHEKKRRRNSENTYSGITTTGRDYDSGYSDNLFSKK
ncbi:hypothetical protein PICMEDRAFT_17481 [Pichia membranifaciens NRRL Y-2026]|uniref:HTH CENPB-type domain-containing protein n=1 Tax=Pichia membranifaciens NRRL Y-2026 TaxID=763406 RepID=A0A1E3NFS9_9ASCO|nr:hypothetical protein PICMEDRAFT_17481 [Pichia membranifaciens NRRL Y-2026]ODQ44972.1 hypothetical protein PICMEDRAFT_17481 [Pichia membranifaciens NRRL Y-2026]